MRKPRIRFTFLLTALVFSPASAIAEVRTYDLPEENAELRPGPGQETAQENCLSCHSADYVSTQPRGLGKAFWEAEVTKMRKAYGAPISDENAKIIVEYLTGVY
ncbi:MAG: cytochrome c [Hyphomicrobiales bacterium]|nr:MAG: cytochrome c [Hyphomicrobiales bacterium]